MNDVHFGEEEENWYRGLKDKECEKICVQFTPNY